MYAPRVRQGLNVPHALGPFVFATLAIILTIVVWGVVAVRTTSNEGSYVPVAAVPVSLVQSVAYVVPRDGYDAVYTRPADGSGSPDLIATFPSLLNVHLRGAASPRADTIAVLQVGDSAIEPARLTLLSVADGAQLTVDSGFDYLSAITWAPDGSRLDLVRTSGTTSRVLEVSAESGAVTEVAAFENALQVAPVGFSMDLQRLFIVVVDQSGSTLWANQPGGLARLATLSPGPTRDWALSPDGARLAFIDRLGVGERSYAARTLSIATGRVKDAAASGDQLGAAWRPGASLPDFGGPQGTLALSDPDPGAYVLPFAWSPDGSALVAGVYTSDRERALPGDETIEVMTADRRLRLSDEPGVGFLGWVRSSG